MDETQSTTAYDCAESSERTIHVAERPLYTHCEGMRILVLSHYPRTDAITPNCVGTKILKRLRHPQTDATTPNSVGTKILKRLRHPQTDATEPRHRRMRNLPTAAHGENAIIGGQFVLQRYPAAHDENAHRKEIHKVITHHHTYGENT